MRLPSLRFTENLLFALLLIFFPTQLGKHFWPDFSFIYSLQIDYLSPTVYFWDLVCFALITIWLLKKPQMNPTALTLLLLFFFSQLLSLLSAANVGAGFVRLYQYFAPSLFALYIASQKKELVFSGIKKWLPIALIGSCLIAIGQFLLGRTLGLWILGERSFSLTTPSIATFNWVGEVFLRPYATFSHPNVLAGFIVISLFVLFRVYLFPYRQLNFSIRSHYLFLTTTLFAVVGGLLTFSRTAIVVLLLEVAFLLKKQRLLFFLLLFVTGPFLYVRFISTFNFDLLSFVRREELAVTALAFLKSNPLTGIGLNNFINEMASSSLVSGTSRFLQPVHNIFLLVLSETGILGFLGLLIFLLLPLFQTVFVQKKLELLFLFGIVFFLGFFDHYLLTLPQGQRLFFFVWGLTMLEYDSGSFKESSQSSQLANRR